MKKYCLLLWNRTFFRVYVEKQKRKTMKHHLLTLALFLILPFVHGQEIKQETHPRTAIEQARGEFRKALPEGNSPVIVKSIATEFQCLKQIDIDSLPAFIGRVEEFTRTNPRTVERCVLHSLLAEFYNNYYNLRIGSINERTPVTGYVPQDMNEWTRNIFLDKIACHVNLSLAAPEELEKTTPANYEQVIRLGKDSPTLRPSLFDFLAYRAIDLLVSLQASPFRATRADETVSFFCPLPEFLSMEIEGEDLFFEILRHYQQLLRSQQQRQATEALILSELSRLSYLLECSENTGKNEELFRSQLKQLCHTYRENPYSVEVIYVLAQNYYRAFGDDRQTLVNNQTALRLCEDGLRRFPNYRRIDLLEQLRDNILFPEHHISTELAYPGQNVKINLGYRNLNTVTLTLYKVNVPVENYHAPEGQKARRQRILSRTFLLPELTCSKDTVLTLPIGETGLFEIVARYQARRETPADTLATYCTRLAGIRHVGGDSQEVLICDRMSGRPVPEARVRLFQIHTNRTYRFVREVEADSNGIATFDIDKRLGFQVVCDNDNHAPINNGLFPLSNNQFKPTENTYLFTDRSTYRPGQTVYFKGICWNGDAKNAHAIAGKRMEISLRDAQSQEVSRQTLTTNEFGSFAGQFILPTSAMSGFFAIEANGEYHSVNVMEYKRPNFEIRFNPIRAAYKIGDKIHISGQVNSFSGIPLDQCEISYTVTPNQFYTEETRPLLAGKLHADKEGNFEISIATDSAHFMRSPFYARYGEYVIDVNVTASNGETQSESHTVFISPEAFDIRVRAQNRYDRDSIVRIQIQAVNKENVPLCEVLSYKLQALEQQPVPSENQFPHESPPGKTWAEGTFVTPSGLTRHPDSTLRVNARQMPSGAYLLTLSGTGEHGNVSQQEIIYLYSRKDPRPPVNTYAWAVPVKTTCAIGEEAEFIFGTSVENAHVLYEIYNGTKLLRRERLLLSDENRTFRVPYEQEFGSECEILFTYLKNDHLSCTRFELRQETPDKTLDIATSTFRDRLTPGQTEEWTFTVKNHKGESVMAEWLAGMYDASLDKFGDNRWSLGANLPYYHLPNHWAYTVNTWSPDFYSNSSSILPQKEYRIPEFSFDTWTIPFAESLMNTRFYMRETKAFAKTNAGPIVGGLGMVAATAQADKQEDSAAMPYAADSGLPSSPDSPLAAVRRNFNETAFFYPQLRADSLGRVVVRFTVPESTTTWRFQAIAHTPEMSHGRVEREIITTKEFMVSTNLPRFVRAGDRVVLRTTIHNQGQARDGEAALELFDPATDRLVSRQTQPFRVDRNGNQTLAFSFDVPKERQLLGCRIVAAAGDFSDGEQHLLPVAPDETLITKTVPVFLTRQGKHDFKIKVPKGASPYRLTLEMTANPTWYAVLALPGLTTPATENATDISAAFYTNTLAAFIAKANPEIARAIQEWSGKPATATTSPLSQNEELKSILLQLTPWVAEAQEQTDRMRSLSTLFDENRQKYLAATHLGKLGQLQNADGGWAWFKGFRSSPFITLNVLQTFARLTELGALESDQSAKEMQAKALRYLDQNIVENHRNDTSVGFNDVLYLRVRSAYRDIPLGDALAAHKALLQNVKRSWPRFDEYAKALAAVALYRYGERQTAVEILSSLREFATITPGQGMFWANNRTSAFANSAVLVHASIMAAFHEIEGDTPDTDRMKQWLLCQKQTRDWGDAPSSVEAIHALLLTGSDQLASDERLTVSVNKKRLEATPEDARLGYVKHAVPADKLTAKTSTVSVEKQSDFPSWGGVYLQYFQKMDETGANSAGVAIEKKLYLKQTSGRDETLMPLDSLDGSRLRIGDRLTVRVTIRSDRDMEFVHLRDLRAANLEPVSQQPGTRRQGSLLYYQETRDIATNFFFDVLPRGTHILEYDVWISQAGDYTDGAATLQCVYAPQFSANSDGGSISVPQ